MTLTSADTRPSPDATRIPAHQLMQRIVDAVPELSGFHFEDYRVVFHLRDPHVIDGREVDEISIRDVSESAWMRVSDIDWGIATLRGILAAAQPPQPADGEA
jgi:hypothetical protein